MTNRTNNQTKYMFMFSTLIIRFAQTFLTFLPWIPEYYIFVLGIYSNQYVQFILDDNTWCKRFFKNQ